MTPSAEVATLIRVRVAAGGITCLLAIAGCGGGEQQTPEALSIVPQVAAAGFSTASDAPHFDDCTPEAVAQNSQ